jgi:hypothetical protein
LVRLRMEARAAGEKLRRGGSCKRTAAFVRKGGGSFALSLDFRELRTAAHCSPRRFSGSPRLERLGCADVPAQRSVHFARSSALVCFALLLVLPPRQLTRTSNSPILLGSCSTRRGAHPPCLNGVSAQSVETKKSLRVRVCVLWRGSCQVRYLASSLLHSLQCDDPKERVVGQRAWCLVRGPAGMAETLRCRKKRKRQTEIHSSA